MVRPPLLVFFLAVVLYAPGLGGGFIYDDERLLVESRRMSTAGFRIAFTKDYWGVDPKKWPWSVHYRPLAVLTYSGLCHAFGVTPFALHGADILLHASATLALYFLVTGLGLGNAVALACAALFAVHPLHVEAVAWMAGLPETLAGAAVLGSLACFVHRRYAWSWLLAAAALLSKETALVLPGLIFVLASGDFKARLKAIWPFAVLDLAYLVARSSFLPPPEKGTLLPTLIAGVPDMPAIAAHYLRSLFVPWPLAIHYLFPSAWQIALAVAIAVAWIALWRVPGMVPAAALACLPLLLPVVTSALMLEFLKMQDRYAYIATAGACLAVAVLLRRLPGRGLFFACLLLVPLGALASYLQIQNFESNETFWTHTLQVTPESKIASLDLGYQFYVEQRFGEAERVYREALRYNPGDEELQKCLRIVETEQQKKRRR